MIRVTQPEAHVYACLARQPRWLTNLDIAADTGLTQRTVRSKTRHLYALGLLDRADSLFPSYGYRITEPTTEAQAAYRRQLEEAGVIYRQMAEREKTVLSGQAEGM